MAQARRSKATQQQEKVSRRRHPVRAKTIPIKKITKEQLRVGRVLYPEMDHNRPESRAQCAGGERPCPYVSCKYHLYLDVNPVTGSIKFNFPELEVWELEETCALDVAERGGITLEEVGQIMNLTRERVRQLEMSGLGKLHDAEGPESEELRAYYLEEC